MIKVIMGVGIPGSGKTTTLKKFADKNNYPYICPDDIRLELTGNAADQTKNNEVWGLAKSRLLQELGKGNTVVFDATFTNEGQRLDFISFARKSGAEKIQGIYTKVPLEVAKERNLTRERRVPERVLERMHEQLQRVEPSVYEGMDTVFTIDEQQELIDVERNQDAGRESRAYFAQCKIQKS